jgi:Protein of unknown function (DUF3795)
MPEMIAYCGLFCTKCPAFLATRNDDDEARAETAAMYAEKYGFSIKPEEINCDGCHSKGGKLISYCRTCEIRKCGRKKALNNCASCPEQPCQKLIDFHAFSPEAEAAFDAVLRDSV